MKLVYTIIINKRKENPMSYEYLTKKQANVVYAAYKRGEVSMDEATINRMYGMVGVAGESFGHFSQACDHIINGRLEMAQAELDGKDTREVCVMVEVRKVVVTEENEEEWPFSEIGDVEEEEIYEWVWKVA